MVLIDCFWSANIAEITVHASYFGLALINNHLAVRRFVASARLERTLSYRRCILQESQKITCIKTSLYNLDNICPMTKFLRTHVWWSIITYYLSVPTLSQVFEIWVSEIIHKAYWLALERCKSLNFQLPGLTFDRLSCVQHTHTRHTHTSIIEDFHYFSLAQSYSYAVTLSATSHHMYFQLELACTHYLVQKLGVTSH